MRGKRNVSMKRRMASLCIGMGMCLVVALVLGACGGGTAKITDDMTPTQTVEAFLESFKAQQWDNMDQIYAGSGEDFAKTYQKPEEGNELSQALYDAFMGKLFDFDYEVGEEKIAEDGKTATVEITTKTYDMVEVFNSFYQEYMGKALDTYTGKSSEMTEEDLQKMAVEILQEEVDKVTEKTYEGEAAIALTKTDGRWVVDRIDEKNKGFLNAVSGGMMDVAEEVIKANEEGN